MEHVREPPPPSSEESTPSLPPVLGPGPGASVLLARLEELRQPGVEPAKVDAFLHGLLAPPPPGESPRERADLMLDILEDERLCELTGTDDRLVGLTALESLLELGFPYALEVTPEMLARARRTRHSKVPFPMLLGLGLALLNVLAHTGMRLFELWSLPQDPDGSIDLAGGITLGGMEDLPPLVLALLGPPVLSALAEWYRFRGVKSFFNAVQFLVSGLSLYVAWSQLDDSSFWHKGAPFLVSGVLALLTALCLTPNHDREP